MGLEAIYPKKKTSSPDKQHEIYPYLLKDININHSNQVWSSDITYIQMEKGFLYLVAIIDWFSRFVISWRISNTLETSFCSEVLLEALSKAKPEIFNTDQGSRYTAEQFTGILKERGIRISMDGRGRALDNVFVERLWRTVKYENIYLVDYASVPDLEMTPLKKGLFWRAEVESGILRQQWAFGQAQRRETHVPRKQPAPAVRFS